MEKDYSKNLIFDVPIKGDQGEKGEKGDMGEPGKDGRDGKDGVDGRDGKSGRNGVDGINGSDGKNGSPDSPKDIAKKLNTLTEAIDASVIKGAVTLKDVDKKLLDGMIKIDGRIKLIDQRWGGHGGGSGKPAGTNENVQFNNNGVFGGDSNFNWDNTNKGLILGDASTTARGLLDIDKKQVFISPPTNLVMSFFYNDPNNDGVLIADGQAYGCRIFSFKTISAVNYYSTTSVQVTQTANSSGASMGFSFSFTASAGVSGYRVYFLDPHYNGIDIVDGSSGGYVEITSSPVTYGRNPDQNENNLTFDTVNQPTPTNFGPDLYVDSSSGDIISGNSASFAKKVTAAEEIDSPTINLGYQTNTGYEFIFTTQFSPRLRFLATNPSGNNNPATPGDFVVEYSDQQQSNAGRTLFQLGKSGSYGFSFIGYGSGTTGTFGNNGQAFPRAGAWQFNTGNDGVMSICSSGSTGSDIIMSTGGGFGTKDYIQCHHSTGQIFTWQDITHLDGKNLIFGTSTGTKIGSATTQKISFWNATPIVQPTTAVGSATRVGGGGTTITTTDTFDGYTISQMVKALRNEGLLA